MNASLIKNSMPQLALVAAIIVTIAIAFLSLLPGADLPAQRLNDKMSHFIAYGVLSFLIVLGRHKMSLIRAIVIAIGYGLVLEALQGAMPFGRSASWLDALANTGGVMLGASAAVLPPPPFYLKKC